MHDAPAVLFLRDEAILSWIQEQDAPQVYRYRLNTIGSLVTIGFGFSFLVGAWAQFSALGFDQTDDQLQVGIPLLLGLFCFGWFLNMAFFVARCFVILTDEAFAFGRGNRLFVVHRDRINRDTVRWERMRRGPFWMSLPFSIVGWRYTVPLVNPFFHLRNLPTFVAGFLQFLLPPEAFEGGEDEEAPGTETPAEPPTPA